MKQCAYCGQQNSDEARWCRGCGTELGTPPAPKETLQRWSRIAVLQHEVEAECLALELDSQQIPHVLRSYGDSAFDGLFQGAYGWGHVEGPPEQRDAILATLKTIRQGNPPFTDDTAVAETAPSAPLASDQADTAALRRCVACDEAIPDDAVLCPKCGWTSPPTASANKT